MKSCGYAVIKCVLEKFKISYQEEDCGEYSIMDIIDILSRYEIKAKGYQGSFDMIEEGMIIHLEKYFYKHYMYIEKKGLIYIYIDNHGRHYALSFMIRLLFSGYMIKINESNE